MSVTCARSVIFSGYTAFSSVNIRGRRGRDRM
jgi:hypothetical protein